MKAKWGIGIAMVIAAGLWAQPPDCGVNVYINKGMALPIGMLPDATAKATVMFHEIGVAIRMRDEAPPRDLGKACGVAIVIEFENARDYPGASGAMAYAKPYQKTGTCIHVFVDRIRHGRDPYFANTVLAHVMAHEIAHVLEGVARHSDEGIMKAGWSGRDYQQMKSHPLPFATEDVDLIHEGVSKRLLSASAGHRN